jgi:pyruvate formate lyase activating enzyme
MPDAAVVFNIQRFSIHDGPGIRTTVFLKGCSMACFWCHNPEGRKPRPEIMYHADRCISCGECVEVCPNDAHSLHDGVHAYDRDECLTTGECVKVCCSEALELVGRVMTVDEVLEEALRDRPFYETSGGGVTISGGEPTLKSVFSKNLMSRLQSEGIHTAIETCGNCHWEDLESILPVTDLVMLDLKSLDREIHKEVTEVSNERIVENARRLAETPIPLTLRTPIVPAVNESVEDFESILEFVLELRQIRAGVKKGRSAGPAIQYELLTFHKLAADKYRSLGMQYAAENLDPPSREKMNALAALARERGVALTVR